MIRSVLANVPSMVNLNERENSHQVAEFYLPEPYQQLSVMSDRMLDRKYKNKTANPHQSYHVQPPPPPIKLFISGGERPSPGVCL